MHPNVVLVTLWWFVESNVDQTSCVNMFYLYIYTGDCTCTLYMQKQSSEAVPESAEPSPPGIKGVCP